MKINTQKLLAALAVIVFLIICVSFFLPSQKNLARPDLPLTIPAVGQFPPLDQAMKDNSLLRSRVENVLSYDEGFLFANYRKVNSDVADILFLWSGMKPETIKQKKGQELVEIFIRRLYDLPYDEPVYNNPFIGENPWPNLFSRFKTQLLMQGNGHKVYDGVAYYHSVDDRMVIEGKISKKFVSGFSKFVKTRPANERKRFINNFLSFIDQTKGLKNLNVEEKSILRSIGT